MSYQIKYPRKIFLRNLLRYSARGLFPLLSKTKISGLHKYPKKGPLIIIGNHTGAMEVVLMATFSKQPPEFMGAVEMPWKGWMGVIIDLYGLIPVYRGYTSTQTMKMGLEILQQGGVLGIFPEGGFWEPGKQQAKTGAAWLSYMTQTPILPVGFGDTRGKLAEVFRLKRPFLEMNVGDLLDPVKLNGIKNKKDGLRQATDNIMEAVWRLVPEEEKKRRNSHPENEVFRFIINIYTPQGEPVKIPSHLIGDDFSWISRFAHRPNLINSIRDYIFLPVQVFKELDQKPSAEKIYQAAHSMIEYVENENPQYFIYRYGDQDGSTFHTSFRQLRDLMKWVMDKNYLVEAEARYEFTDPLTGEKNILHRPVEVAQW